MDNETKTKTLAQAAFAIYPANKSLQSNPWLGTVDKVVFGDKEKYASLVKECRFYFRHDPLVFTVISKMVDLSVNKLIVKPQASASKTEIAIFDALSKDILAFLRKVAFEYLITGLVAPEVSLTAIGKTALRQKRVKRINNLYYPTALWVRNSADIKIRSPLIGNKESYFLQIPLEVIIFIQSKGVYENGEEDKKLYAEIVRLYPEFVQAILDGKEEILLENPLILKATTLPDSPYPISHVCPALESLKHKRNLRRMDYSLAARVITAILHVKVGSDEFPLTKDQEDELTDLEKKFRWRENITEAEVERVFSFFTNHTVELNWVFPDVHTLLNADKYDTVNQDIMVALGFPRILITGETERSFSSDPQIATISPIQTMEGLQRDILPIAERIFLEMYEHNAVISSIPKLKFKSINLMSLQLLYEGLQNLYEFGILSREDYAESFGYELSEQVDKQVEEDALYKEKNIEPFKAVPHSNTPDDVGKPKGSKDTKPRRKKV